MTTKRSRLYLRPINVPHPTESTYDFSKLATPIKDGEKSTQNLENKRLYAIFNTKNADVTVLDQAESVHIIYEHALRRVIELNSWYAESNTLYEIYIF